MLIVKSNKKGRVKTTVGVTYYLEKKEGNPVPKTHYNPRHINPKEIFQSHCTAQV